MRKFISITVAIVAALASTPAFARHHQHVRHVRQQARVEQGFQFPDLFKMPLTSDVADYGQARAIRTQVERVERVEHRHLILDINPREREEMPRFTSEAPRTVASRPGDCYGIQWCGCFMRHYFGIADRALNLAANWAGVGTRTSAHPGAIVVWRHHVGVLQSEPDAHGRALVLSGNNGSGNRATIRPARITNAIAFRQL